MAKLTILGSAAAAPDDTREHAYMVLEGTKSALLIDCGGSPLQRLQRAGVDLDRLEHLILTHHHPDHIYGVPMLILGLWLTGHPKPLHIYGLLRTVVAIRGVLEALEWREWGRIMPVSFHTVEMRERAPVLETDEFEVVASPARHIMPSLALRVSIKSSGKVLVYSGDTEPCDSVTKLAEGADLLIHESTGPFQGHSTPGQAGQVARLAGVRKLVLIHYPSPAPDPDQWVKKAAAEFSGPVELAREFASYIL